MKVIYPGPSVDRTVADQPTLHPDLGEVRVGVNEIPDRRASIARRLVENGFFAPSAPQPRQERTAEAPRPGKGDRPPTEKREE